MFDFFTRHREPQPLFFKTDIHCHVLPGIDDGAPDAESAVALVKAMQEMGLERIIASPHVTYGTFENTSQTADESMARLQDALKDAGIDITLSHSAENRIDDLLMRNLEAGTLMTLPGGRLIIENSFMQEPWNLDQLIFDLQVKGFKPIMAHPERYPYYYTRKDRLPSLVNSGLALQVNVLSLAGYYGAQEKKAAEALIERGLVTYLGTDIHRQGHIEAINRYLASKDYLKHRAALEGRIQNDLIPDK